MKDNFKSNYLYYACQLFGISMVWGLITVIHMQQEPTDGVPILMFIENSLLTFIGSHFIIRRRIKAYSSYGNFNTKVYAKAILLASVFYYAVERINDFLFYDAMSEKKDLTTFTSELTEFGAITIAAMLIFIVWCTFYVSITSIRDSRLMAQQLKEQKLASLMNQVNPHFLFNSLNAIRGMIYENRDKAAELVTQLASLFRYNLSLDTHITKTVAEELQVCQQYLDIESIRLGSRLRSKIVTDDSCQSCKIPTMGLLTLVENAIKHGIAHLRQGGELTIHTRLENDQLIVDVSNPYDPALVKAGTQVGLENLNTRIKLLTAGQGSLTQSSVNNIFLATLCLPKEF